MSIEILSRRLTVFMRRSEVVISEHADSLLFRFSDIFLQLNAGFLRPCAAARCDETERDRRKAPLNGNLRLGEQRSSSCDNRPLKRTLHF
jgi:hypothetical protein